MRKASFLLALWWLLGSFCLGILLLTGAPRTARPSLTENRMLSGLPEATADSVKSGAFMSGLEDFLSDGFFARDAVVRGTEAATALFDLRSEEERAREEEAETDRLLREDAEGAPWEEEDAPRDEEDGPDFSLLRLIAPSACAEEAQETRAEPTLTIAYAGEKPRVVYTYPHENIRAFAGTLDTLRALLPEDGEVHYLQVPVASIGRRIMNSRKGASWTSTMEDELAAEVGNGVYVHNVPAILNDALARGERCYFYTDHHWTDLGAWYCAAAVQEARGYPAVPYEETAYDEVRMGSQNGHTDVARLLVPLLPTRSEILTRRTEAQEIPFMNRRVGSYTAYINNTRTPWRRFTGGFGSARRALLISDSFGNAFLPYLLPYYGEVHMTDLRAAYYDPKEAGGTFRELLALHEIDDVYVVLSTSNGINSSNSLSAMPKAIGE